MQKPTIAPSVSASAATKTLERSESIASAIATDAHSGTQPSGFDPGGAKSHS